MSCNLDNNDNSTICTIIAKILQYLDLSSKPHKLLNILTIPLPTFTLGTRAIVRLQSARNFCVEDSI